MFQFNVQFVVFCVIAFVTIASAIAVAVSRNIVHAAFALLGVFVGVLGLYILLSADFVAMVQLVVYIGGILILILFAVMLTTDIAKIKISNRAVSPVVAITFVAVFAAILGLQIYRLSNVRVSAENYVATTAAIGERLLGQYLIPFEVVSLLLVLALVGALVIGRRTVNSEQ